MPAFTGSTDFQEDAHGNTVEEGEAEARTEVHRRAVRSHSRCLPVENVVQGLSAELGEEIPSLRGEGTRAEEEKEDWQSRQGGNRPALPVGRTEQGPRGGIRRLLRSGVQLVPVLFTIRKEHGKVHR